MHKHYMQSYDKTSSLRANLLPKEEETPTQVYNKAFSEYVISKEDIGSLTNFSIKRNIDLNELMAINSLDWMDDLYEGQKIMMPRH
ncbi:rbsA2 [Acrasis kona]|uniref:RbsA2 n=1 Tax=Acrasis kona TaxID=1008807 RepID=A0AAW2Z686_9EUKA